MASASKSLLTIVPDQLGWLAISLYILFRDISVYIMVHTWSVLMKFFVVFLSQFE
jgi:hypothetical protein